MCARMYTPVKPIEHGSLSIADGAQSPGSQRHDFAKITKWRRQKVRIRDEHTPPFCDSDGRHDIRDIIDSAEPCVASGSYDDYTVYVKGPLSDTRLKMVTFVTFVTEAWQGPVIKPSSQQHG